MEIDNVKTIVENLWSDISPYWQDDMSKKYKTVMIDQMEILLNSMSTTCRQLIIECEDTLRKLERYR